ncbi:MAG: ABC transporter [Deltaproteobacteria bacterium HGW-Deltaproteobacteria-15]|jgi:putative ATP-binding cassette transporter|nr:MAG: ABC transporter [Deltaproteobacteria bacterium HGW-Deltaproteobacteria-15]
MKDERIPINRQTLGSFLLVLRQFATAEKVGRKAVGLFALLIFFLFGLNGLNVLNSYVSRDFMTAIEYRNYEGFVHMALVYIGLFIVITLVSVTYSYTEQLLGLVWREWAAQESIMGYANHRVYYRLKTKGEVGNPDQRIADDIRTFSVTTLSFLLMLLNGTLTVIAFSGVLWTISPKLFIVAVLYSVAGTFLTFVLGRPLVRLNYDQLDKEANFRGSLIYLRGNAESLALSRREGHLIQLSFKNLGDLAANFRRIIAVSRNVGFFTTGYNWLIQIIPALIVAPLFINGKVEFGVISQSAIAFTHLLGAFSLIVTQFQSISSYTATSARLATLKEACEREANAERSNPPFSKDDSRIVYEGVTLRSPRSDRVLIRNLLIEIPQGRRVLVRGEDETARSALFHATAGLWDVSEGKIVRPRLEQILFLPELPYLPPGTVRELLMGPWPEEEGSMQSNLAAIQTSDERIMEALEALKIESLLKGFGGMDKRNHWENTLPLDDQQLLVIARLLVTQPRFAFLDRPSTTLNPGQLDWILALLKERSITYVTFEAKERSVNLNHYDVVLELEEGGAWAWKPVADAQSEKDKSIAAA